MTFQVTDFMRDFTTHFVYSGEIRDNTYDETRGSASVWTFPEHGFVIKKFHESRDAIQSIKRFEYIREFHPKVAHMFAVTEYLKIDSLGIHIQEMVTLDSDWYYEYMTYLDTLAYNLGMTDFGHDNIGYRGNDASDIVFFDLSHFERRLLVNFASRNYNYTIGTSHIHQENTDYATS